MIVRGAMAIGVSAAMGVALGIDRSTATNLADLNKEVDVISKTLAETRPTAVNLFWGIAQIRDQYKQLAAKNTPIPEIKKAVVALANRLYDEDIANLKKLGALGAALLPEEGTVLTHCNAGALAACGYGSALGVIRAAVEAGKKIDVFADETRPFNQGTRLTAWELVKDNIPTTLICDNMAGYFMSKGRIQAVIVGADRIAANGDAANKIGTYSVSILAKEHGIPFYVAAPFNTIDLATATGEGIPIEQRGEAVLRLVEPVGVEGVKGGFLFRRARDRVFHLRQLLLVYFKAPGELGVLGMVLEVLAQFIGRGRIGRIPDQGLTNRGPGVEVLGMLLEDANAFSAGSDIVGEDGAESDGVARIAGIALHLDAHAGNGRLLAARGPGQGLVIGQGNISIGRSIAIELAWLRRVCLHGPDRLPFGARRSASACRPWIRSWRY